MYERLLDKQHKPTYEEYIAYCGNCKNLFEKADDFLTNQLNTEKLMRFPYGNSYGWAIKYFIKNKNVCDVFAEKDAFTVMLKLSDSKFGEIYNEVTPYTREYIDNRYPCGSGGWIHYRVVTEQHFEDAKKMLELKIKK